jgi:hypothetical protein
MGNNPNAPKPPASPFGRTPFGPPSPPPPLPLPAEKPPLAIRFEDGSTQLYKPEEFATGGQGKLYISLDGKSVVKLYSKNEASRLDALHKIIGQFNITRGAAGGDTALRRPDHADLFAWIDGIAVQPGLGVRMRNVNDGIQHERLSWWLKKAALDKLGKKHPDLVGNWLGRANVAMNMVRIAWKLHGSGLCHSDFSGDNFLANVSLYKVVLIDLDNLVVPDVIPPAMLGTGEYMAPEIVTAYGRKDGQTRTTTVRPSIETDLHSLAVLLYQLLLQNHPLRGPKVHDAEGDQDDFYMFGERALYKEDPHDSSNRPANLTRGAWLLGEEMEGLLRTAFTAGLRNPKQRPLASQWSDALLRMIDQIIPCPNQCPDGYFVLLRNRPAVCPWCQAPVVTPKTVPIFQLYSEDRAGHYQQDRGRIVGWVNRTLHRWHVRTDVSQLNVRTDEDRQPLAVVKYNPPHGWQLLNLALPNLRVAEGGSVSKVGLEQAVTLNDGQQWLLDHGQDNARLALVEMQLLAQNA